MTSEIEEIAAALGWTIPRELAAVAAQLSRSAWPEMMGCWSRLTPTGFPIELTAGEGSPTLRWTTEIAGPEIDETHRLGLVARHLAEGDQPLSILQLDALQALQRGRDLQYGAWLGGRTTEDDQSWFKLYCEIPAGVSWDEVPLPTGLRLTAACAPMGVLPRMIGIEPARNRIEVYLRLPTVDPDDLRPLLTAAGHSMGLEAIERSLPQGTQRLVGRRLGISLATGAEGCTEVAVFVSARSLFPGAPEMLQRLVPAISRIPDRLARLTLVTLRLAPGGDAVSFAVGVTVARP